jgi:hypothetical protein
VGDPSICFVVGAGFSCAFSSDAPPMVNFLDWAYRKAYYRPTTDHQALNEMVSKYFGSATNLTIEDLASFLALDLPADFQTARERRPVAYDQLMDVIVDTLAGAKSPRDAKVKNIFERFAGYVATNGIPICSPSAQVGQFRAIEQGRIFGSSLTAEGAEDGIEKRGALG